MTPCEQALVDAYKTERLRKRGPGDQKSPTFVAVWFVKRYGTAEAALRVWMQTEAMIIFQGGAAKTWGAEVTRLLLEAAGEMAS